MRTPIVSLATCLAVGCVSQPSELPSRQSYHQDPVATHQKLLTAPNDPNRLVPTLMVCRLSECLQPTPKTPFNAPEPEPAPVPVPVPVATTVETAPPEPVQPPILAESPAPNSSARAATTPLPTILMSSFEPDSTDLDERGRTDLSSWFDDMPRPPARIQLTAFARTPTELARAEARGEAIRLLLRERGDTSAFDWQIHPTTGDWTRDAVQLRVVALTESTAFGGHTAATSGPAAVVSQPQLLESHP